MRSSQLADAFAECGVPLCRMSVKYIHSLTNCMRTKGVLFLLVILVFWRTLALLMCSAT